MNNPKKVLLCSTILMLVIFGGMNIAPAQTTEQIAEKALAASVYVKFVDIFYQTSYHKFKERPFLLESRSSQSPRLILLNT